MTDENTSGLGGSDDIERDERKLGLDAHITRRDFLNASLLGMGASLLRLPAPITGALPTEPPSPFHPWTGYGGIGDYAKSNGNTWEVVNAAHMLRDGKFDKPVTAVDTGEIFDLIVVGGGASGLGAAYFYKQHGGHSCVVLDNHPMWGGEAKRNEFMVDGQRLIGPQGSNDFGVPKPGTGWRYDTWMDIGLPTEFTYRDWPASLKPLEFHRDNYYFQLWMDEFNSHAYFFDAPGSAKPKVVMDAFGTGLDQTPWSPQLRGDFIRWRTDMHKYHDGDDVPQWLDTMTYEQYLVNVMKLDSSVARFVDPILAAAIGLGSDVLSAYSAFQIGLPGFQAFNPAAPLSRKLADRPGGAHSFPGGNDGIARHFVKSLVPDAIEGEKNFNAIMNGRVNWTALDKPGSPVRLRLGTTVVRVEHDSPSSSKYVWVTYTKGNAVYKMRAKSVVMANGGWSTKHAVRDLPESYRVAYESFPRAPMLVVNVALRNWQAMYKMGITAGRWFSGFGFSANIRQPMLVGDYQPPLDPAKPTLVTFYVPFNQYGLPLQAQATVGRTRMMSTSYRDYETQIRQQLLRMFGDGGFDPRKDIAGIILNRWGHAYVCPAPGFYFARDGKPAPRDIVRQNFGRISFAHSELNGHQHFFGGVDEGKRAVEQAIAVI